MKPDNGMHRCWLKDSGGDALHAALCAAGAAMCLRARGLGGPSRGLAIPDCTPWETLHHSATASDQSTTILHRVAIIPR